MACCCHRGFSNDAPEGPITTYEFADFSESEEHYGILCDVICEEGRNPNYNRTINPLCTRDVPICRNCSKKVERHIRTEYLLPKFKFRKPLSRRNAKAEKKRKLDLFGLVAESFASSESALSLCCGSRIERASSRGLWERN